MPINISEILINLLKKSSKENNSELFITLESTENAEYWAQFTPSQLTFAYPYVSEPEELFEDFELPIYSYFDVINWEEEEFVTLSYTPKKIEEVIPFVEAYLTECLDFNAENWKIVTL